MNTIKNWPHYPIIFLLIISKIFWTPNLSWWVISMPLWYWIPVGILLCIYVLCTVIISDLYEHIKQSIK